MKTKGKKYKLSLETIDSLTRLGHMYQEINKRLNLDGYEIKNGKIKGKKCLKIVKKK